MHCCRFAKPLTRREMLLQCANGFGAVALTALMSEHAFGGVVQSASAANPFAPRPTHHQPTATNIVFLYMDGGPSQVDTWDPKPRLDKENGETPRFTVQPTQFNQIGKVMKSPWEFKQYGKSGIPVSSLFPQIATCVDDLCVIRSMTSNFSEHTNANYFLHTGHGQQGRPSMGAWATYGLGTACQDLPGFVVINGGLIPPGGLDNFNSGFLPATYQGSVFKYGKTPVANLTPTESAVELQRGKLDLLSKLDKGVLGRAGNDAQVEAAIANYELAFRMQATVPKLADLSGESAATKKLYGIDAEYAPTRTYGTICLLARRLVERGVRFLELTCPGVGHDRWDQHGGLKEGHEANARAVDQPIAGLLKDLKSRGLLDHTLVVWGGEFGRTPMAQGANGRDHNPFGYTIWMAGGGVKGGHIYGATDEYGYHAVENKVEMWDLHATWLHLMGIDHKRLTYRFGGRDMRLTDVHGEVLKEIVA